MTARIILGVLSLLFLVLGAWHWSRPGQRLAARTWLIVGAIFGIVSAALFLHGS